MYVQGLQLLEDRNKAVIPRIEKEKNYKSCYLVIIFYLVNILKRNKIIKEYEIENNNNVNCL